MSEIKNQNEIKTEVKKAPRPKKTKVVTPIIYDESEDEITFEVAKPVETKNDDDDDINIIVEENEEASVVSSVSSNSQPSSKKIVIEFDNEEDEEAQLQARLNKIKKDKEAKARRLTIVANIEKLRQARVAEVDLELEANAERLEKLEDKRENILKMLSDIDDAIVRNKENRAKLEQKQLDINIGNCDDEIINKELEKPVKVVVGSKTKARVNRGYGKQRMGCFDYFGSDTLVRDKTHNNIKGLVKVADKKVISVDNRENRRVVEYNEYNEKTGLYSDETSFASEFKTLNAWLKAERSNEDIKLASSKKSVWVACEFFDKEHQEWVSLKEFEASELTIN